MKVTIVDKNENILLNRIEVKGGLSFEGVTISNAQLKEALAKELKKEASLIVIKTIQTNFGQPEAKFFALVYNNQDAKQKAERMTKHLKKKAEEAKKVQEEAKAKEKKGEGE